MASVLPMPSGNTKWGYRQHRLVVLPDFQGLGIGTKFNDFLAEYYINNGMKYFIRTSHVRLIRHMENDSRWRPTSHNGRKSDKNGGAITFNETSRICGSFQYMGEGYSNKPHKNIITEKVNIEDVGNKDLVINELRELKEKYFLTVTTGKTCEDTEIELLCKSMGIRTELLYIKIKGKYKMKKIKGYN